MIPVDRYRDGNLAGSVMVQHLDEQDYSVPYHAHADLEISLIRGKAKQLIGNEVHQITGLNLVMIGQYVPHTWFDYAKLQGLVIHFNTESIKQASGALPELHGIENLLQQAQQGLIFPGLREAGGRVAIGVYEHEMNNMLHMNQFDRLMNLLRLLETMAADQKKRVISPYTYPNPPGNRWQLKEKVLQYMLDHFTQNLSIDEVAQYSELKLSAFCHFFKQSTGIKFSHYLNRLKIGYAAKLLTNKHLLVSEVGFQAGYNSLSNFNKRFKEIQGLSPTAFRKKLFFAR